MSTEQHYHDNRAVLTCRKLAAMLGLPREANYHDLIDAVQKVLDGKLMDLADDAAAENAARTAELTAATNNDRRVVRAVQQLKRKG